MEQELDPEESLRLIQEVIAQAKESFIKISPFFISWGVVLMLAGILEFYFRTTGYTHYWIVWPAAGLLGGVVNALLGFRQRNAQLGNKTFMDRLNKYLWGAFGVSLIIVLYLTVSAHIEPNAFVMCVTAIPTFVTGSLLRFAPMKYGAFAFWLGALLAHSIDPVYSGLIFSVALFFGYLLPGILLMRRENGVRTP